MFYTIVSQLIMVILTFWSPVLSQCPPIEAPCRCVPSIYEPIAILCENAGSLSNTLSAIRMARNLVIDSLTIIDTAVESLHARAFLEFFILRLVLNRNQLSHIDEEAFVGPIAESLVELDMSDNNLLEIPQNGVSSLLNLRKLYLNRNRVAQHIHSNSFANYASRTILLKLELASNHLRDVHLADGALFRPLSALRELSLETNALTNVPTSALDAQRATLTNLNLGLNQIRDLPPGVLDFPQLISLSLEFNGISVIVPQAFRGVPNLQYLYLTGNKFPIWQPDTFRHIGKLRTLGIGETPITLIPTDAFIHTPNLMRLEMSEAAVNNVEPGAFQKAPFLQAIVLNKNRFTRIFTGVFSGLLELYSIDLQGNRIGIVEPEAFANLPSLRHLDISFNQLETLPFNTFDNSFKPLPDDRRVIYACANPWQCDSQLEWFRQLLRENADIDVDRPGCVAACASVNACPAIKGTLLRAPDPPCVMPPIDDNLPLPLAGTALSFVGWIILAVILTILVISICLMALIRYGMSQKRKKEKVCEIETHQKIISSDAYPTAYSTIGNPTIGNSTSTPNLTNLIDIDLPQARNLEDWQNYYI